VTSPTVIVFSRSRAFDSQVSVLEKGLREVSWSALGVELRVIPHLYDLPVTSPTWRELREELGDLILLCCLYPRAAYWVLQAHAVSGEWMHTSSWHMEDRPESKEDGGFAGQVSRSLEDVSRFPGGNSDSFASTLPANEMGSFAGTRGSARRIWCFDLRAFSSPEVLLGEIMSILVLEEESAGLAGSMKPGFLLSPPPEKRQSQEHGPAEEWTEEQRLFAELRPRWYPVVDYSRCRGCLQCLNFCLFGVYGLDGKGKLSVDYPDACRDGCPACARLCPTGAIIFPMCSDPLIAGAIPGDRLHVRPSFPVMPAVATTSRSPQIVPRHSGENPTESAQAESPTVRRHEGNQASDPLPEVPQPGGKGSASKSVQPFREEELDRYVQDVDAME